MSKSSDLTTSLKQEEMLKALRVSRGTVRKAAVIAQITPQTHYNWYKNNEDYRDKVDHIKYEVYEEYKDIVIEAVFKKVQEGNSAVINRSFQTLFAKWAEEMERGNPYRARLIPQMKFIDKPEDAEL